MLFTHNDMTGRKIDIGDIVIFTQPGAGRNLPALCFGEVEGFTKASIRVFYLDNLLNRIQIEDRVEDRSVPPYYIRADGTEAYHWIGNGHFSDKEPSAVKIYKNRFFIVKKGPAGPLSI